VFAALVIGLLLLTSCQGTGTTTASESPSAGASPATGRSSLTPTTPSIDGEPLTANLAVGDRVPEFSAPSLAGDGSVTWSDYDGVPRVLSIWAPWCPHCQKELPIIAKVAQTFPGVQVVTVATAVDVAPGPTPAQFVEERNLTFPVAMDDADMTLAKGLGVQGFPTVYFVGTHGTVTQVMVGERSESEWQAAFERIDATAVD